MLLMKRSRFLLPNAISIVKASSYTFSSIWLASSSVECIKSNLKSLHLRAATTDLTVWLDPGRFRAKQSKANVYYYFIGCLDLAFIFIGI